MVTRQQDAPSVAPDSNPSLESTPDTDAAREAALLPIMGPEGAPAAEDRTLGNLLAEEETAQETGTAEEEKPAEPTVAPTPPERPFDVTQTPEYRRLQSQFDSRYQQAVTQAQEAQRQAADVKARQTIDNQISAFRQEMQKHLTEQGWDQTQGEPAIERAANILRDTITRGREEVLNQIREQVQTSLETQARENRTTVLGAWAQELATRHKLSDERRQMLGELLFDEGTIANDEAFHRAGNRMERLARLFGPSTPAPAPAPAAAQARVNVPAERPGGGPDSGVATGAARTPMQIWIASADPNSGVTTQQARAAGIALGYLKPNGSLL